MESHLHAGAMRCSALFDPTADAPVRQALYKKNIPFRAEVTRASVLFSLSRFVATVPYNRPVFSFEKKEEYYVNMIRGTYSAALPKEGALVPANIPIPLYQVFPLEFLGFQDLYSKGSAGLRSRLGRGSAATFARLRKALI